MDKVKRVLLGPLQEEVDDEVQRDQLSEWRSLNCVGDKRHCFALDRIPRCTRRVALLMIAFCWSFCVVGIPVLVLLVIAGTQDGRFSIGAALVWLSTQPVGFAGVLAGTTKTVRMTYASLAVFSACSGLFLAFCSYAIATLNDQLIQNACVKFELLADCKRAPRIAFFFLIATLVFLVVATVGGLMLHARFLKMVRALKKWRYQQLCPEEGAGASGIRNGNDDAEL